MGFGLGLQTPRRRALVRAASRGILTTRFALLSRFSDENAQRFSMEQRAFYLALATPTVRAAVVVPVGTPPPLGEGMRDEERARALVQPPRTPRRSLLGDARDLFTATLRRIVSRELNHDDASRDREALSPRLVEDTPETWAAPTTPDAYVHIGPTTRAVALLQASARHFEGWDGDWHSLDADGYVLIALRDPDLPQRKHLIALGGSDYGTYFSVSWLLQQYCGARWLYPGEAGAALLTGTRGECIVEGPLHRVEEPDFRSRTFIMAFPQHIPVELDALRDWQLRNRLRPSYERQRILAATARLEECGPTADVATLALLRSEERFPADHNLASQLSPTRPMIGVGPAARQAEATARIYPDVRVRGYATPPAAPLPPPWINTQHHGVQPDVALTRRTLLPSDSACVEQPLPLESTTAPTALVMSPTTPPSGNDGIIPTVENRFAGAFDLLDAPQVPPLPAPVRQRRFIPRTRARTLFGEGAVLDPQWVPCIYAFPSAYDDRSPPRLPVRDDLRRTLAMESYLALTGTALRNRAGRAAPGEAAHSLAREDGVLWCQCHACTLADELGGPGTVELFFRGLFLGRRDQLTLEALRGVPAVTLPATGSSPFLREHFPADATVATLCFRGVIIDAPVHSHWRSRRIVDLMNAVASAVDDLRRAAMPELDGSPLLTFLAYIECLAPPLFERWTGIDEVTVRDAPLSEPARLHRSLLPWVVGGCDEPEYAEDYPIGATADRRLAHSPQRFNLQRWSYLAAQTGMYEYLYGTGYLAPRIYTERLRNGLRFSRTIKGCAFIGESGPVWGLEGPKLYEAARMLWDVEDADARRDFCGAAFGAVAGDLLNTFSTLEAAWARGRERAQRVGLEANQGFGLTLFHQARDILQFDYIDDPELTGAANAARRGSVIDDVIARLDEVLARTDTTLEAAEARQVRFYRDSLGLTQLMAWLSRPVRVVRHRMFDLSRAPSSPERPPTFNPLYGGSLFSPTPGRSLASEMRGFSATDAAGQDPWPAFYTAIDAVPQAYRDARMFFEEVRGAVTRYLAGEAVRVLSGATLAAPAACVTRRAEAGVEQLDLIRTDGVWQRFGLPEIEDYVAYFNNWMRIRGTPLSLGDPARGRGIQWFFVSLKNTLLIANECLEDRGRRPGQPRLRGIILRPEEFEDAA